MRAGARGRGGGGAGAWAAAPARPRGGGGLGRAREGGAGAGAARRGGSGGGLVRGVACVAAVSKGFGGLLREKQQAGDGAPTEEICPCFVRGDGVAASGALSYAQCCKPYHSGAKQVESAEMLLRSRFSAYSKSQTEYLIRTTRSRDDESMRTLMNDTVASCKRLRFSDLEVQEAAEHDDHAIIKFRYQVRTVGQKGFRQGDLEPVEETSHFLKEEGYWLFNEGATDHNPDGGNAGRPLDNLQNKPVAQGELAPPALDEVLADVAPVESKPTAAPPAAKADKRDYSSLKVVELKDLLRARGLPVSGRKADLVARLETG